MLLNGAHDVPDRSIHITISERFLADLAQLSQSPAQPESVEDFQRLLTDLIDAYRLAVEKAENLEHALESRGVIEQAKGMIMLQRRCSADDAFQTLVAASQARNKKLREIAQEVVGAATDGNSEAPVAGH